MNSKFIVYSKSALFTLLLVAAIYLLVSLFYMLGVLPVPNEETKLFYFFGIWLFIPVTFALIVLVTPFIVLADFLVNKFRLSRKLPILLIFPIGLTLPLAGAIVPIIFLPVILVVMFVYPMSGQESNWGITELTVFSVNFSFAFIIFWYFIGKYTWHHNKPFNSALRAGTPASQPPH